MKAVKKRRPIGVEDMARHDLATYYKDFPDEDVIPIDYICSKESRKLNKKLGLNKINKHNSHCKKK